jgi:glyoxylase-like metal-dependent hydrolase (beta-lactamase superfamily II)
MLEAILLAALADVTSQYETVKVADGVYAFIAPEPRTGVVNGNTAVIIGDDGVIVVDSGQFPTLAARQVAEVRKLTGKPVRAIVNTHWHWDHNLANAVWRDAYPGASIVSTPFTREYIEKYTPGFLETMIGSGDKFIEQLRSKKQPGTEDLLHDLERGIPELKKVRFLPPDATFDRELVLHLGKRVVHIIHPGRANTAGDAVVWVPDARVLVTGDLVVWPTPYATSAYPAEWIAAMEKLLAFNAAAIVPGHGGVQRDMKYVQSLTETLRFVVAEAAKAAREGLTLDQAKARIDLEPYRKRFAGDDPLRRKAFDDYFANGIVTNAYRQAKGETTTEAPVG